MSNATLQVILSDGLSVLIVIGWIFLIMTGLEADKPLSGGIPGHVSPGEENEEFQEGVWGRLGEASAWMTFTLVALALPVVLWWIFHVHP